jgi:hypothetical protein
MNLPDDAVGSHSNYDGIGYGLVSKELFQNTMQFVLLEKFVHKPLDKYGLCTKQHCKTGMFILL